MINRRHFQQAVKRALAHNPVCALLGPRQCGKTTLARQVAGQRRSHYFDLETATGRAQLAHPELTLTSLTGLVVIDEVQRQPDLFTVLRPLVDQPKSRAKFLILGSAAPDVVRGVSESLAGRVGFVDLGGFDLREVGVGDWRRLWLRGGFSRSFLATSEAASMDWRRDFIRTFLERDIPQLGVRIPSQTLRRF
ncbi:MAG TPA: AAA family ATPase [Gemmataceae bacterium]|jgi:predicted AAA+ superfamily ATPase|nr:AAA family ATPase [Gemmataceae bacterium]